MHSLSHERRIIFIMVSKGVDSYMHDEMRSGIPKAGRGFDDTEPETIHTYSFDPHEDPKLDWTGKSESDSFSVPVMSLHEHERITPHKALIPAMKKPEQEIQLSLFPDASPVEMAREQLNAIDAYNHSENWRNRMIAGDSLIIMNSLIQKENMRGTVQTAYIDPPYGIKYGSNFQPFVNKRDVKDKADEDLTCEPEMIRAFRDTWELGIHSYLSYLRNRLLLVRELLKDSGSVFVQISDENVHLVRCICDEVFGRENFVSMIAFRTAMTKPSKGINNVFDYLVWYTKDKTQYKYHQLYTSKKNPEQEKPTYTQLQASTPQTRYKFTYNGVTYNPRNGWRVTEDSLKKLAEMGRLYQAGLELVQTFADKVIVPAMDAMQTFADKVVVPAIESIEAVGETLQKQIGTLKYIRYPSDFPYDQIDNLWNQQSSEQNKLYVVQTSTKVIQRCILMTSDPGDLVLDITCGSGTTAYVAEQWGRRWITCDTSRVAIAIARQRLLTAEFPYYKLAEPSKGINAGFVYKTVPHVTLKSIANNEPPAREILYDSPEIDRTKTRITGPFSIEALPAPAVLSPDEAANFNDDVNESSKQSDWREQLLASGITGRHGERIRFSRVEMKTGSRYLNAEAYTDEDNPRKAYVCFANESSLMDSRRVYNAFNEASALNPDFLIFSAFQFDPEASSLIQQYSTTQNIKMLIVQMNPDLLTEDLRKKERSSQSFWLVGQPDVKLMKTGKNKYKVRVIGFDYFNVKTNKVESGEANNIAMWLLDTNYNGMYMMPSQIFFPMEGKSGGWSSLEKSLRAIIDDELIEHYRGNESIEFEAKDGQKIAVKIIDDRGIESMRVIIAE